MTWALELRARLSTAIQEAPPSREEDEPTKLLSKRTGGLWNNLLYHTVYPVAYMGLYRVFSHHLLDIAGYRTINDMSLAFFNDIGGERFELNTDHGSTIKGFFFDAQKYQAVKDQAFIKWAKNFRDPANKEVKDFFDVSVDSKSIGELYKLPPLNKTAGKIKAALFCIGAGNIISMDPHAPLMYLERNISATVFHYGGILDSTGEPNCKNTCLDAAAVARFVKGKINCQNDEMVVHGKSLGGGPTLYTGTQLPGMKVIVDRSFSRIIDVVNSHAPLVGSLIATPIAQFFPYPNIDLIPHVKGPILVIAAKDDEIMIPQHGIDLAAKVREVQGDKAEPLVIGPGNHSGKVWYSDPATQEALTRFLDKNQ